jgi:hypothetical protein
LRFDITARAHNGYNDGPEQNLSAKIIATTSTALVASQLPGVESGDSAQSGAKLAIDGGMKVVPRPCPSPNAGVN